MTSFPDLIPLVDPRSVAIIGASPNHAKSPGRIASHLLDGKFDGELYLVNPKYDEIDGRRCYASVADLPQSVDLAVVMIPADSVLAAARACAAQGVKYLIIMSSGFSEMGDAGEAAQQELTAIARESGMRIYGPNCPGYLVMHQRRAISFSPRLDIESWSPDGRTALITQGGAMGRAVIDAMESHGSPGLNYWFSTGNEADLQAADFLGWLADEPSTDTIVMVLESIRDGRRFMEAAALARDHGKQIIVLKVGRSAAGRQATATHTAALAGRDAVVDAALRQCGIIRVDDIDELVDLARILDRYPVREVANVGVCSLSGGSAAHLADLCGTYGFNVESPTTATLQKLQDLLPPLAAVGNPVDLTTGIFSSPELVGEALKVFISDERIDALVMPFPYQLGHINHVMAEKLAEVSRLFDKPIIAVAISESMFEDPAADTLRAVRVPYIPSATKAVLALKRYASIPSLRRTGTWRPTPTPTNVAPLAGTGTLSEESSEAALTEYGISFPPSKVASSVAHAVATAERLGYPVVLKAAGDGLAHKSDAGLVRVGIADRAALEVAYHEVCAAHGSLVGGTRTTVKVVRMVTDGLETLCGIAVDPSFGAIVSFGLGGIYAEVLGDIALRVCPLTDDEARELIAETKAFPLLEGARGGARLDVDAAAEAVAALSRFGYEHADQLAGVDVNPLKVQTSGALGLDALVVLAEQEEL
ncbi:acetate--CoA ligase family protein [Leekyejoonella antrihumi]|uniref:Acetate--CoA ligase family protein n=1 Tax=Leekyejoonella antrihumi TaxID=1660198 RepID=A0A563DXI3_9MICO|nr:acetate--CoA ligase family protein [Leekyejoonella antrihumi]TWP34937.1 acetate--CoA ligase family protein [Leekyejoonella antrihumi]